MNSASTIQKQKSSEPMVSNPSQKADEENEGVKLDTSFQSANHSNSRELQMPYRLEI
jgi:hypothetical protein